MESSEPEYAAQHPLLHMKAFHLAVVEFHGVPSDEPELRYHPFEVTASSVDILLISAAAAYQSAGIRSTKPPYISS